MKAPRGNELSNPLSAEHSLAFRLLVGFRWLSLVPPLLWLLLADDGRGSSWLLVTATALTLLLTLAAGPVNRLLLRHPWLVGVDLAISAGLVYASGAESSPFYLYSLAPILAAAFFFQIRGGLLAALVYTLFYVPLLFLDQQTRGTPLDVPLAVGQIFSFFLIGAIFGYPAQLWLRLHQAQEELAVSSIETTRRHRDLYLIDELTLVMQSSVDQVELQETILRGLVEELGYRRAAVGLYDEGQHALTGWLTMENLPVPAGPQRVGHAELIRLDDHQGPLAQALQSRQLIEVMDGEALSPSRSLNKRLVAGKHYIVLPMVLRDNRLGVILVDHLTVDKPLPVADRASLERLAAQAGVTLGSVRLCINRTQREAIMQERTRIAVDLHDSISQVLYGLAYGLDACIQLLPEHPMKVKEELLRLQPVVMEAQAKMRTTIFDMHSDEVLSDTFVARLHRHLHAVCPACNFALRIELPGEFDNWNPELRDHLYRVAQEAMTNAAKHAGAHRIVVTISPNHQHIELRVEDDGTGFDPSAIDRGHHLGIQSMTERVERLGGSLQIESDAQQGTAVIALIPLRQ